MTTNTDRMTIFLAGVGIGVAGAILLAPQSGQETRRRIKKSAQDTADFLTNQADAFTRSTAERITDTKQNLSNKFDAATDTTNAIVDKSRDIAHTVGKKMEQGGKRLQDV